MSDDSILKPSSSHPITIEPLARKVVVRVLGQTIAESNDALLLREARYPAVIYIPREDTNMALLARSDHASHCPYKGKAAYYSIPTAGENGTNAVWTYENPHEAVTGIKDHLAFYPDRVEIDA